MLFLNPTSSVKALKTRNCWGIWQLSGKFWGIDQQSGKEKYQEKSCQGNFIVYFKFLASSFLVGHLGPYVTLLTEFSVIKLFLFTFFSDALLHW